MTIMNRKHILLLDMDDVTVDQSLTWIKRIQEKTGILYQWEDLSNWDLSSVLPQEITHIIYEELNKEPGFFRSLPAKEGALEGIKELSFFYDIVFVTASEHYAYQDKYYWIRENLPFLNKPSLVLTHRKDLIMGDIFVDDGPHNLQKSTVRIKIMFDHPWNRHVTHYPRVTHWNQLVDLLLPNPNFLCSSFG